MTTNDEQWDARLRRSASTTPSGEHIDVGALVLRRVRYRRRIKTVFYSASALLIAGAIGWAVFFANRDESINDGVPPQPPIAQHEPTPPSIADAFPPPVEQLDVIGRHQDAFVAVFENWNEEQP